jgi:hypothetical protein
MTTTNQCATSPRVIRLALRRAELRKAGYSFAKIGAVMACDAATAFELIDGAIKEIGGRGIFEEWELRNGQPVREEAIAAYLRG